jgi:hypothetical protein
MRDRYVRAPTRQARGILLTEAMAVTGYHRKALVRAWGRPERRRARGQPRRVRRCHYTAAAVRALKAIWTAAGFPWSVRLKALLPTWLPWARKRLALSDETEAQLRAISARQMDRVLAADKRRLRRRQYGGTRPGTLLKHHIPIKTDHWDVTEPGFTEVDLVSHSGDRADGEFLHSLDVTDIHTTWVETGAVLGKSQLRVQTTLEELRQQLPFARRGIDSDNGSEFINAHDVSAARTEMENRVGPEADTVGSALPTAMVWHEAPPPRAGSAGQQWPSPRDPDPPAVSRQPRRRSSLHAPPSAARQVRPRTYRARAKSVPLLRRW